MQDDARKQSSDIQNDLPRVTFPTTSTFTTLQTAEGLGEERTEVLAGLRQKILNEDRESSSFLPTHSSHPISHSEVNEEKADCG